MSEKSRRGINHVMEYEREEGREPIDVSKSDSHIGFDVVSTNENEVRTIEVKATEKRTGIPDAFSTEFTRDMKFVASHLYLVRFLDEETKLCVIPKKEIDKYSEDHRLTYRIKFASKLKNNTEKFEV